MRPRFATRFVTAFAALIGITWTAAFFDGIVTSDFTAMEIVTPVMLIAAGAVLAVRTPPQQEPPGD